MKAFRFKPGTRALSLCGLLALLGLLALAGVPWRSPSLQAQTGEENRPGKSVKDDLRALQATFKQGAVVVHVADLPPNQTVYSGSLVEVREVLGSRFLVLEQRVEPDPRIPRKGPRPQPVVTVFLIDCNRIASISQVR
jgi:hypothetical protein